MSKSVERRLAAQIEEPKRPKYNARKTTLDGIMFDSKAEADRYADLKLLVKGREITNLQLQPSFILQDSFTRDGKKVRPIEYRGDFAYYEKGGSRLIVEDVKGTRTREYLLKKKLLLFHYPEIDFREIIVERKGKRA